MSTIPIGAPYDAGARGQCSHSPYVLRRTTPPPQNPQPAPHPSAPANTHAADHPAPPAPPTFNNLTLAHDDDIVADIISRRQVMRDVDDRKPEFVFQPAEEVDDRHAQRGVDHRDRFVGHQQAGLGDQRAGDGDALQLAAGEFVGEAALHLFQRQADMVEGGVGHLLRLLPVRPLAGGGEVAGGLEEITVHPLQRVEGLEGVLQHRLHFLHEGRAFGPVVDRDGLAGKLQLAFGRCRLAEDHRRHRRFARAGFADDREDLRLLAEFEADILHRGDQPPAEQAALAVDLGDMREAKQSTQTGSPVTAKHATRRPGSTVTSGGTFCEQMSIRLGQRG